MKLVVCRKEKKTRFIFVFVFLDPFVSIKVNFKEKNSIYINILLESEYP